MNRLLCPVVLCLLAAASFAQSPKQDKSTREIWIADRQQLRQAYDKKDWTAYRDALLQYHKDFPGSSRALKDLGTAEAMLGNGDAAATWLQQYVDRGLVLDFRKPELAALKAKGKLDEIDKRVQENSQVVSKSQAVFRLSTPDLIAEDIAYDPGSQHFFISSMRQRKILRCEMSGKCADFVTRQSTTPLGGMLAVRADASRKFLWATTANMQPEIDHQKSDEGKSALLKFDLDTGKLLKRYEPQDAAQHALGDMVVARNGDAFISDGLSGDVFAVFHDQDKLELLVPSGSFLSPQTPALSEDQQTLFVPDYSAGVAAVDLSTRSIRWLDTSVALDGTDGLYLKDGWLIAVQNGVEPERVARFRLHGEGKVDRGEVLESNTPGLGDPTHGVIVGNDFYFIANSGWDRVEEDGTIKAGEGAEIRKARLQ